MKKSIFLFTAVCTGVLGACSDSSVTVSDSSNQAAPVSPRLKTFDSDDAFYAALKDALIRQGDAYNVDGGDGDVAGPVGEPLPVAAPDSSGVEAAESVSDSSVASDSGNEVTSTNVQEVGVDEADRVKVSADGRQLFVLATEYSFAGEPEVLPVGIPVTEDDALNDGLVTEPATPTAGDRLSARSSVLAPEEAITTLRILELDPETPDARGVKDLNLDLDGLFADGFFLHETAESRDVIVTASGGGYWAYWNDSYAFRDAQGVIAKVDVSNASDADIIDSFTLDGQIISSRRIGDSLYFVSRYYPAIDGPQPWELTPEGWEAAVEATDISTLLPEYTNRGTNQRTSLIDPASCFVAPGAEDLPYTPDIITLGVIDLSTMQLGDSECFLGATETLYANTESVILATTQYNYGDVPVTSDGVAIDTDGDSLPVEVEWSDPRQTTDIHQFDISQGQLSYAGSGSVRGHLGWNTLQRPFRISEANGYVRIATMNDQQGPDHSPILLHVLQADGQTNLETISSLPNSGQPAHIGKPGEQLYASRFLGDRAYLVTFRQTDPLYVINLADPANPVVEGELEIQGYSDYLHPITEDLLLGIGKDAVAATGGRGDGRGAWVQGIKLSLFDVSDPTQPTEVTSVLVGERGTHSVALSNHRAITIQAATEQHPTRVSFGIDVYGRADPVSSPAPDQAQIYRDWNYTGLHGFDVTAGPNAGILPRGALIIDRATDGNRFGPAYGDDRSVMVNDAVFYIHGKDVYSALWDNLSSAPQPR